MAVKAVVARVDLGKVAMARVARPAVAKVAPAEEAAAAESSSAWCAFRIVASVFYMQRHFFLMLQIPFYQNLKDDTHCVQACLKSILKFYFPQKHYSFKFLDKVTVHKEGKWTWNSGMLLFLAKLGFEVVNIEDFSYREFAELGEKYLRRIWTDEVLAAQTKFSDIANERKLAKQLVEFVRTSKRLSLMERPAHLRDIRTMFRKGYILLCPLNPYVLDSREGYAGHVVVVTDVQRKTIMFHDPGLPPDKNRTASIALFIKAMCYASKDSARFIAVRLPGHSRS